MRPPVPQSTHKIAFGVYYGSSGPRDRHRTRVPSPVKHATGTCADHRDAGSRLPVSCTRAWRIWRPCLRTIFGQVSGASTTCRIVRRCGSLVQSNRRSGLPSRKHLCCAAPCVRCCHCCLRPLSAATSGYSSRSRCRSTPLSPREPVHQSMGRVFTSHAPRPRCLLFCLLPV